MVPLFIVGLASRFEFIKLNAPFDLLSNTWVLVALGLLLLIEIFADKIPAVDSVNDMIHTFIRPTAGGILFAAQSGAIADFDPVMGFILGLVSAGGVHAAKAATRPVITATTGGIGNPIISFAEDLLAAVATILAIVAWPIGALMMALVLGAFLYVVLRWRIRRRRRRALLP